MSLNLQERSSGSPVFSGGISIDHMSWWFWIKAGIGFTLGASTIGVALVILSWLVSALAIGSILRMFAR